MSDLWDKLRFLRRFHMPYRHAPALYLALGGIMLSLLLFGMVRRMEYRRIQADLDRAGEANLVSLSHGLDTHLLKLESLAGFHAGSEEVTRAEFHDFVKPILRRLAGIQALEWIPRVPHSSREEFVSAARQEIADFMIKERGPEGRFVKASDRGEYFPIYYIEPGEENADALGFDLCSEPNCCATIQKARDTGQVTITPRMKSAAEESDRYGFIMFYPIYGKNLPLDVVEQRRENFAGLYAISSDAGELLAYLLTRRPWHAVDVYIFDVSASPASQLLYFHSSRTRPAPIGPTWEQITDFSGYQHKTKVQVAGSEWLILTTPAPAFIAARRAWESWAILGTGIAFSMLLAAYVSSVMTGAAKARRFAAEESRSRQYLQREIAVRKRAEKQRQQLMDALAERNEEMANLLYVVSHDLRAPLVNIRGFAAELESDAAETVRRIAESTADSAVREQLPKLVSSRLSESVRFISTSAEQMEKLLDGLRNLSRTGRVELKIESLDMNRLMRNVVDSVSYLIKEGGASVAVEELPPCAGDADQINQVFSNLVNNALKYLDPDRPGRITVTGHVEGDVSIYCVRDNGIGIPPDQHSKIFDIFHRVDPRSAAAGEGLGLTTVKQILTRHNGRIWLESAPGKGSAFFVALPRPDTCGGVNDVWNRARNQ